MNRLEIQKNITEISDFSNEFGIDPQFIEKDIYVVLVLDYLSKINYPDVEIIFSGGTCLSKAYKKIKRFSEDIDFRIHTKVEFNRTKRKDFFEYILSEIKNIEDLTICDSTIIKANENKFLSLELEYKKHFHQHSSLRPNVKLEFTFENTIMPYEIHKIKTLIGEYFHDYLETEIKCINPNEVLANKFSALMWRVQSRNREAEIYSSKNDPTIIRHLHDVSVMCNDLNKDVFSKCLEISFVNDKGRGSITTDFSLKDFALNTYKKLKSDKLYPKEYTDYVQALSYAKDNEKMDFETALENFKNLISLI